MPMLRLHRRSPNRSVVGNSETSEAGPVKKTQLARAITFGALHFAGLYVSNAIWSLLYLLDSDPAGFGALADHNKLASVLLLRHISQVVEAYPIVAIPSLIFLVGIAIAISRIYGAHNRRQIREIVKEVVQETIELDINDNCDCA